MRKNRSLSQGMVWTGALLALGLALVLTGTAGAECPMYGCQATLTPLTSGGYVVQATAVFEDGAPHHEGCVTPANFFVVKDGHVVQKIPASWTRREYFCCCSSDWIGTGADLLSLVVDPGTTLTVVLGEERVCTVQVVAPVLPASGSPCDGTVTSSASEARER